MLRVVIAGLGKLFRSRGHEEEKQEMGFFEHLEELRRMLIQCIASFVIAMIAAFYFSKEIFAFMRRPLLQAQSHLGETEILTDSAATQASQAGGDPLYAVTHIASLILYGETPAEAVTSANTVTTIHEAVTALKFMDVFSILMNIGMVGGLALSGPFILFFASKFIAPALTEREKKCIVPFCVAAMMLFIAGAMFSFFWLTPISIKVMYHFIQMFDLRMTWMASDYYSFVVMMVLIVAIAFQFPLIVIILQYLEIVQTRTLIKAWRHVLIGILIGSLVITPLGDPVSLSVLTGILFLLYVLAVSVGGVLVRSKQRKRDAEAEEYEREYRELSTNRDADAAEDSSNEHPSDPPKQSQDGDLKVLDDE
ncbi:MAG: twin-arginine translocase subunit TatC [Puniceicoccales bacterium]|jgi:sec-independent protein translocase protein TatC|nr:twin-arginine translocase subunit TatC [Puniceicoccales bacterium]